MSDKPNSSVPPEPPNFPEANFDGEPAETTGSTPVVYVVPAAAQDVAPLPEPTPHVEHSYSPASFVCVRCGSTNLARGYVVDYGEKFEQVRFAPKRISLQRLNSLFNLRPWRRLLKLNAEACRDCGAVLLVVDPDELRRAEPSRE